MGVEQAEQEKWQAVAKVQCAELGLGTDPARQLQGPGDPEARPAPAWQEVHAPAPAPLQAVQVTSHMVHKAGVGSG